MDLYVMYVENFLEVMNQLLDKEENAIFIFVH